MQENHTFEQFYKETFTHVRTFIFAKCNDMELAQDLAQETFVKLWANRDKIDSAKSKSFAFTICNNLFLDHIRHTKVIRKYESSNLLISDIKDPHFYLEMSEFKIKLDKTIDSMPIGVKEVFLLNRMEKLTYQQIANDLNLSVKAIEKRMQKALEIISTLNVPKF